MGNLGRREFIGIGTLAAVVALACGAKSACCFAAEPVAPVGKVAVPSKDRVWKVVYGTAEGPEGRALELLTSELGSIYVRDPGVYTLHVMPCEKAGTGAVPQMTNAFLLGTLASNAELAEWVKPGDVPKDGYLVRTVDGGRKVVLAGDTPAAVIWAVSDFLEDGLAALSVAEWDGLRYRSKIFERPALGAYESRRAPRTKVRSVFTWAHVIDDYRAYFRNLARLKVNEAILWNNRPPVNAREVAAYARSWGVSVLWGYAWGWSTDCTQVDFAHLDRMEDDIVREWREVWKPLGGDGIYFQSFTEIGVKEIDGHPIAETVVGLVNRVTKRIRAESPSERIVFGLHASSVSDRLAEIDRTDPSVEIYWEDCGGWPFNYGRKFDVAAQNALTDRILAEDREVALVIKCMLVQDWKRFAYQSGPYVLGCDSEATKAEDARVADELWKPFLADWQARGRIAYDLIRRIQTARPDRPAALNAAVNLNGAIRPPMALVSELFWSADEPYETIVNRVLRRTY